MFIFKKLHLYIVVIKTAIVQNHGFYVNCIGKKCERLYYPECNLINTSPIGFCLERDYSHAKYTPDYIDHIKECNKTLEYSQHEPIPSLDEETTMEIYTYQFVLGPWKCDVDNGSIYVHIKRNYDNDDDTDYHFCFEPQIWIIDKETLSNISKLKWYVYRFNDYCTLMININGSKIEREISFHSREKVDKYCYYDDNWNLKRIQFEHRTNWSIPHIDIKYKRKKTLIKISHYENKSCKGRHTYLERKNTA